MRRVRKKERGAALIIVLLLAATLSFIVLALIVAMSRSIMRTSGVTVRNELLWRAISVETLAARVVTEALRQSEETGQPLTPQHPLFSQQFQIPFEDGGGAIIFADATRCFNVNSLAPPDQADTIATGNQGEEVEEVREFAALLSGLGFSEADGTNYAHVIRDWVDKDDVQEVGGAEDGFYTGLPTPFRTGGGLVAAVSELRAMRGITPAIYARISPFLCAPPTRNKMAININMLRPDQGVLISAITGGVVTANEAADLIERRPPGGWTSVDQFLALPAFQNEALSRESLGSRFSVTSNLFEARAGATVNEINMNVRLLFAVGSATKKVGVISRQLGSDA